MKTSSFRVDYLLVAIVAFAGFWLLRLGTGSAVSPGWQFFALLAGLARFVGAVAVLFRDYRADPDDVSTRDPAVAHFLFASARSAPLWLGARIYLGYAWLEAG